MSNTSKIASDAIKTGVTTRSKSKLAVASNLYHLLKSLGKINAVLLNTDIMAEAVNVLAKPLSMEVSIDELTESKPEVEPLEDEESESEEEEDK